MVRRCRQLASANATKKLSFGHRERMLSHNSPTVSIASSVMATDRQAWGIARWPILAGAFFIFAGAPARADSRPDEITAFAPDGTFDRRAVNSAPRPRQAKTESSLRGNPLWAIPVEALAETRARPIFSPSRRPPSPPVVASPSPPTPKPPPPREPDRLKLTLLGTVIGTSDSIAVFLDETSKEVIRIKAGASHDGWTLSSVHRRAASFEKNSQETTLMLGPPGAEQPASDVGAVASRSGGVNIPANRGAANPAENRALPAAPTVPISAPMTRSAHKIRQDILSIGVQN